MHLFPSTMDRSMPIEWWIEFIKKINTNYPTLQILLVGAPKDVENAENIIAKTKNVTRMCGKTVFLQTVYIIKNARLSVDVNSGPSHFASFYQKPQLFISPKLELFSYLPTNNPLVTFFINNQEYISKDIYAAQNKYEDNDPDKAFLAFKRIIDNTN